MHIVQCELDSSNSVATRVRDAEADSTTQCIEILIVSKACVNKGYDTARVALMHQMHAALEGYGAVSSTLLLDDNDEMREKSAAQLANLCENRRKKDRKRKGRRKKRKASAPASVQTSASVRTAGSSTLWQRCAMVLLGLFACFCVFNLVLVH